MSTSSTSTTSKAHRNTTAQILNVLIRCSKSIWQRDLAELIGISRRSIISALQDLQKEKIITIRLKAEHRNLISIKPEVKKAFLEEIKLLASEAKKAGFLIHHGE